jgi:fructose-bisphosphate aldolase class 1
VLGVLKVRDGALDRAYLRAQAISAGLDDLLQHALSDAKDERNGP